MKLCVFYVYWMLLFTSFVSSALLFLIVASENTQNNKFIGPERNQALTQGENVTFINNSQEQLETNRAKSNIKIPTTLKSKISREQKYSNLHTPISASFEIPYKNDEAKIPKEIEVLKESLTQQPNLSQGISDDPQSVVLTLVDTSATLQSLADFRSKSTPDQQQATNASTRPSSAPGGISLGRDDAGLAGNGTDFYDEEAAGVVVVRAERKQPEAWGDEESAPKEDEAERLSIYNDQLAKQQQQQQEVESSQLPITASPSEAAATTTAPDLNDGAARARLTGSEDGAGAAILDSFVTAGPSEPHEDIPSFNEWAQKRLEEAEKKKTHPNVSVQGTANGQPGGGRSLGNMRTRSKNYASPDCGAKVVAANPESRGARNVLVSTRDEYMLNTCTSRVWFVVELCEAIQAKKIELANFELFSSLPKDLAVYVSDRFPTRDWSHVGTFTGRDERDVQSFSLQPQLFGKFIKVELLSHHGSEHFCPISLFRAYGTSEFEVLETETETEIHEDSRGRESSSGGDNAADSDIASEDEDDEPLFEDDDEISNPPSHLFGSARDAVLSILKKATEVLIKSNDLKPTNNITKIQESIKGDVLEDEALGNCVTPIYNVACHDCDDDRFAKVFQLISCKGNYLEPLLNAAFVRQTLTKSHLCGSSSGFDFRFDSDACTDGIATDNRRNDVSNYYLQAQFLSSLFTPDYIIALCNVLAAREQRLFANTSHEDRHFSVGEVPNRTSTEQSNQVPLGASGDDRITSTRGATESQLGGVDKAEVPVTKVKLDPATQSQTLSESLVTKIKPTKTTTTTLDESKKSIVTNLDTSRGHPSEDATHQVETSAAAHPSSQATKRTSTSSHKTSSTGSQQQDHTQPSVHAQDKASQRDVPTTPSKVVQHGDGSQRDKSAGGGSVESGGEAESKQKKADDEAKVEVKGKAAEAVEQEPTKGGATQDQLNFDGFEFDVDSIQSNGKGSDGTFSQQTTSSMPQQKESVFLRLSNRIKALERNMSLSSQYLEELSRRYKKQVEEMQRTLERAMTVMNDESRKGEEREVKRLEEVTALRNEIETLTKTLDELVYERNHWHVSFASLLQYGTFLLVNVVIVIVIISYRRRADGSYYYEEPSADATGVPVKAKRGKMYEIIKPTHAQLGKKQKKRRPSEIASQVSGTYDQLMIDDSSQLKKDKKKKKKKETLITRTGSIKESSNGSKTMHSRSASASDAYAYSNGNNSLTNLSSQRQNRPESAPDTIITYFSGESQEKIQYDKKVQIFSTKESQQDQATKKYNESENNPDELNISMSVDDDTFEPMETTRSKFKRLASPSFMKTALNSRNKRISFSGSKKQAQSFDEGIRPLERKNDLKMSSLSELKRINVAGDGPSTSRTTTNGHAEESDESRASSSTPTSGWNKKEKKSNGLKKMVRKFF